MQRGSKVKLDVIGWDEVSLSFEARFLELLSSPDSNAGVDDEDEGEEEGLEEQHTSEAQLEQTELNTDADATNIQSQAQESAGDDAATP